MTRLEMLKAAAVGARHGIEVGVQRGDFSAELLTTEVQRLWLVDCWERFDEERFVRDRFRDDPRIAIIKGFSEDAVRCFPHEFASFVLLDAGHTFDDVLTDLRAWSPIVRNGGKLFVHGFVDNEASREMGFGVVAAVNLFVSEMPWKIVMASDDELPTVELSRV